MLANPVSIYSINQDKRMIGFMIASRAFPATIKVYRLYDTEALTTTITITADDCVNDDHYYFTRDFSNQLPEKDGYCYREGQWCIHKDSDLRRSGFCTHGRKQ